VHLRAHFPPEAFINTSALRSERVRKAQKRIAESREDHKLINPCILRDGDRIAGSFIGEQKTEAVYRMWHTHLHPDYRRRGIYSRILQANIAYTGELGFDTIVSEHAPGNNPVLIAKLGAGFRIVGLDVEPMVGVSIHLCYFHNEDQLAAYEYRCGLATMNPRILAQGAGAMDQLVAQFREE
jgi:RimJ/RimL family protein N-acetyltransferase